MFIFNRENLFNGWSLFWKVLVAEITIEYVFYVVKQNFFLDFLIWILRVGVALFIYDFFGKIIAKKRYNLKIRGFFGWSILWRQALIFFPYGFFGALIITLFLGPESLVDYVDRAVIENFCLAIIIFIVISFICSIGRAVTRVIRGKITGDEFS